MSERLVIEIIGDSTKLTNALKSAENRLNSFNTRVTNSSRNLTNLNKQIASLGMALSGLTTSANASSAALARTTVASRASSVAINRNRVQVNHLTESFRRMVVGLSSVQTMFYQYAFFIGGFIASIIHVNSVYETQLVLLKNLSKASTEAGKAAEAKENVNYIWDLASNAPFSLSSLTDAFVKLKVAGIEPTNGSLQALTDSVAAFGGSSENLKRAAVAIQQMGGKGVISMEELRQQLGEAVPNAMFLMASAMKMTMRDFVKEVSKGGVESKNALEKMFVAMQIVNGGKAKEMMNTWTGMIAKLETAYTKFVVRISSDQQAENGFFATLKRQIDELTVFLNSPFGEKFARDVSEALARIIIGLANLIKFVYEWRDAIVTAAKVFFAIWAGKLVIGTITSAIAMFVKFNGILLTIIKTIMRVGTVANGVQLVMLLFGRNTAKAAAAAGLFNTQLQISRSRLAALAAGAIAAKGPLLILIGTIWAAVAAYKAYNNARNQSKELDKIDKEGGVLSDEEKESQLKTLETRRKSIRARRENLLKNASAYSAATFKRLAEALNKDIRKFNVDASKLQAAIIRTTEANQAQAVANFQGRISEATDKMVGTINHNRELREDAINKDKNLSDQQKADKVHESYLQSLDELAVGYQKRYDTLTKFISEGEKAHGKAAIEAAKNEQAKVLESLNDTRENINTLNRPNPPSLATGNNKPKSDGLDGLRNRLVNLKVSTAELRAEVSGTQDEFDSWETEQVVRQNTEAIKSEKALREAISKTREEQKLLKAELKVQDAIKDINADIDEQKTRTEESFQEMTKGYVDIDTQLDRYNVRLNKRHAAELELAAFADEQNAKQGKQTSYLLELSDKIDEAERSRHEELVNNAAIEATQIYEERLTELMTVDQRREFYFQKEMERLKAQLRAADDLGEKGVEQAQRIQRAMDALTSRNNEERQGPFARWAREAADFKPKLDGLFTSALDGFAEDLANGEIHFKKFAKSIIKELLKIIIRALIAKAILTALGLPGGFGGGVPETSSGTGLSGGVGGAFTSVGVDHTGGIVGNESISKTVHASMFDFAKRYHTGGIVGLKQNEVPIIAEKGEGVFTKEQMKSMNSGSKGGTVQVNVINQTGVQAEVERKPPRWDGEKMIEDIILKKMTQPGPVRDAINLRK